MAEKYDQSAPKRPFSPPFQKTEKKTRNSKNGKTNRQKRKNCFVLSASALIDGTNKRQSSNNDKMVGVKSNCVSDILSDSRAEQAGLLLRTTTLYIS